MGGPLPDFSTSVPDMLAANTPPSALRAATSPFRGEDLR